MKITPKKQDITPINTGYQGLNRQNVPLNGSVNYGNSEENMREKEEIDEKEVIWTFCYESFLLFIRPHFSRILRGETVVGSAVVGE